jgi:hypothetical protein
MSNENMEIPEIVGSKDLRDVFTDKGEVKGSFFINNVEFHQFRATTVEGVIGAINARQKEAFVTASIDDGFHLVLEAHSPAEILIRPGQPYVETTAANVDATAQAVRAAIEASQPSKEPVKNTVLEDLGLDVTHDIKNAPAPYGMQPGMNADDRKRARYERAVKSGAIKANLDISGQNETKSDRSVSVPQLSGGADDNRRYNPVTPADKTMPAGGFTADDDGRGGWEPGANNPKVQVAPSSNSDRQPTMDDMSRS